MPPVEAGTIITGLGAVSCLGRGQAALWRGLAEGRDGLRPIRRFSTAGFQVQLGGLVPERELSAASPDELCLEFAAWAAREAWSDSGLLAGVIAPERTALVLGTSPGDHELCAHELSERLADELGALVPHSDVPLHLEKPGGLLVLGPRITVSTACSSSTNAIGIAIDLLESGAADVVLAGGSDVLTPLMFSGFHALGVLSPEKCAPFSFPYGTSLGEGSGFFVLESAQAAHNPSRRREPAAVRARLLGYGLSCDAFHDTSPDPTGAGVARALTGALWHARLSPDRVGYVNVHGTGTAANDPAEWRALLEVFGGRARQLPVSSTKSVLGHAQAAAGALELCATILGMERGRLPQTLHFTRPRQHAPDDPVAAGAPRASDYRYAASMNSAFGGANAALVVGAAHAPPAVPALAPRPVFVAGLGVFAAHGHDITRLARHLEHAEPLGSAAPPSTLGEVPWPADPRRLDPSSRALLAALALGLHDAGVRRLTGSERDATGCIAGITRLSPEAVDEIRRSIEGRGLPRLSASAFARMVLNAPLGSCAKILGLRGATSTLSIGAGSGLLGLWYAARWLGTREGTARMIGAGLDEPTPSERSDRGAAEGAACLVLSLVPAPGRPLLAGWGLAGPACESAAVEQALGAAGVAASDIDVSIGSAGAARAGHNVDPAPVFGSSQSLASAAAAAVAAHWLREGRARHVLITTRSRSATLALVMSRASARSDHEKESPACNPS